ncbi:hypothetical protein Acr_11g0003730 [Actinidia rufa]|uniref:Uncharacterized protein n=1 Tax=Actinidia rufa TaxID=165716 RepID=A0A7J0FDR5_9ERIC|nr:hypothetical protein Acr_11g0003730 [Actinidia rufa]
MSPTRLPQPAPLQAPTLWKTTMNHHGYHWLWGTTLMVGKRKREGCVGASGSEEEVLVVDDGGCGDGEKRWPGEGGMVEQKRVDSVTGGEVEEGEKGMPFGVFGWS